MQTKSEKIINYLYTNDELRLFMLDVMFKDLSKYISKDVLFNNKNYDETFRENSYWTCFEIVGKFLRDNSIYKQMIRIFFVNLRLVDMIEQVLINFTYYKLDNLKEKNKKIFCDKRSILYAEYHS